MIDLTGGRPGTYTTNLTYTVEYEAVEEGVIDLSAVTGSYTAQSGDILTGKAGTEAHITVAAGARITLKSADITSIPSDSIHEWAGITPLGDATIILEGKNTVKGGHPDYPGIFAAVGKTLTIKGTASLTAENSRGSSGWGAGIGGGDNIACGNIMIEGGTITATGGDQGAGIGGGHSVACGNITITGGTVTAVGGSKAAGIGSGGEGSCGTITIANTVTSVTATAGGGTWNTTQYSIGAGNSGTCGTVTIGGTEGAITQSPYTYPSN